MALAQTLQNFKNRFALCKNAPVESPYLFGTIFLGPGDIYREDKHDDHSLL